MVHETSVKNDPKIINAIAFSDLGYIFDTTKHISHIKMNKMMGHWLKSDNFSRNNGSLAVIVYVESIVWWTTLRLDLVNSSQVTLW